MDSLAGKFQKLTSSGLMPGRFLSKLAGVSDPEQKRKLSAMNLFYVFDDDC